MPRDPRTHLWDAVEASDHAIAFVVGRVRADYAPDVLLRSAVERQLTIVGDSTDCRAYVTSSSRFSTS